MANSRARRFRCVGRPRRTCATRRWPIDRGFYVDESGGKITFAEWAEQYFATASRRLARTSYARDMVSMRSHILPRWGKVRIGRITKSDVERWIVALSPWKMILSSPSLE